MNTVAIAVDSSRWQKKKLDELGKLFCGQSPSAKDVNTSGIGTVYVTGPEQWDDSKVHLSKWTTDPKRLVPEGCIFITVKGAGVGKTFPGIACAIGRDVYAFKPCADISEKFIYWVIIYSVQDVIRHAVGDIPGLSKSHILDHEIFVPTTIEEQFEVVSEIEKQFSRLDEAVSSLKRIQANLKRYKAAVLKAAVEGKLTEQWRKEHPDVEPADKLLKRIHAERRARWEAEQLAKMKAKGIRPKDDSWKKKYKEPAGPDTANLPDLSEGWVWARLETIAALKGGITVDKKRQDTAARQVPYLRVANVQRGFLDLTEMKGIEASPAVIEDLRLLKNDILFNEGGDRDKLGRGWIWEGQLAECIHQNHVFRARLHSSDVSAKLISWWGNTFGKGYFLRQGKQTTNLASINLSKLSEFPVPLIPVAEQRQIVEEVEACLSVTEDLEALIGTNLKRAERLRQSILHSFFGK